MVCPDCGRIISEGRKICDCGAVIPFQRSPSNHRIIYSEHPSSSGYAKQKKVAKRNRPVIRRLVIPVCALFLVFTTAFLIISVINGAETSPPKQMDEPSETPMQQVPDKPVRFAQYADGAWYLIFRLNGLEYDMVVANKTYCLPEEYGRGGKGRGGLDATASDAFDAMGDAAYTDGYILRIISGYRSYESQISVFQGWVNEYGSEEEANKVSARPGQSEHQTGLTVDLNSLSFQFAETATYQWLETHAAEYGFIERYPKDKEETTGYVFEPWHYRYVGVELAVYIKDSGKCVEDFIAEALYS